MSAYDGQDPAARGLVLLLAASPVVWAVSLLVAWVVIR